MLVRAFDLLSVWVNLQSCAKDVNQILYLLFNSLGCSTNWISMPILRRAFRCLGNRVVVPVSSFRSAILSRGYSLSSP